MATLLGLIADDQLTRVTVAIERAIADSLAADRARVTRDEVRRRFSICERLLRQLRGDLKWGLQRVLDHIPRYLRYELDGVRWEPDARVTWVPEDDSNLNTSAPPTGDDHGRDEYEQGD